MKLKQFLLQMTANLIDYEIRYQFKQHGIDPDNFERQLREFLEMANKPRGQNPFLKGTPPLSTNDAYQILGLKHTASSKEIKTRYQKLVCENHPDKHDKSKADFYSKKLQKIVSAYNSLKENGKV